MPEENVSEAERLKSIEDKLSAMKDTQNIVELDMINLKNELEGIKLASPSPVPPEVSERIVELEKISKKIDVFKMWEKTVGEVRLLRSKVMGIEKTGRPVKPGKPPEASELEEIRQQMAELKGQRAAEPESVTEPPEASEIHEIRQQMAELREQMARPVKGKPPEASELEEIKKKIADLRKQTAAKLAGMKRSPETPEIQELEKKIADLRSKVLMKPGVKPLETGDLKKAIKENRKIINDLKGKVPRKGVSISDLKSLKKIVEDNSRSIDNLKVMLITKHHTEVIPDVNELKKIIEENKHVIEKLRNRIAEVKSGVSGALDARVTELVDIVEKNKRSIEDLKVRTIKAESKGGAELPERMEDEIEELRDLLFSKLGDLNVKTEKVRTDELKKMIIENREAMGSLRERVHAIRTQKGTEFPLPLKDRIIELEKMVNRLNKKIEGTGLKPIKIPTGMRVPSSPSKTLLTKVDKLKKNVDDLLKRTKTSEIYTRSLVRKEDLVALENALKPQMMSEKERKMVSENIYKELENVKKAILRNEDHINNMVSDVEGLKKGISAVEKHEWDEGSERPTLENLTKRIEEIEQRLKVMGTASPVFIE